MLKTVQSWNDSPSWAEWYNEMDTSEAAMEAAYFELPGESYQTPYPIQGYLLIDNDKIFVADYDFEHYQLLETDLPIERDSILAAMRFANQVADTFFEKGVERGHELARGQLNRWLSSGKF